MKRHRRCVGKKSFAYLKQAKAQVIYNFVLNRKTYGIYECPTCLDFHTTSTYDNRTKQLRDTCDLVKKRFFAKSPEKRMAWLEKYLRKYANPVIKQVKKKQVKNIPPDPKSKTQILKAKKLEYKKSIVPLKKQKELLAKIDNKQLSTWGKILHHLLGII